MSELILTTGRAPTMTSREIATLTSKRHDNVVADIKKMLAELGEDALNYKGIYLDSMNREQTEYLLDRELTETLLTGYSALLRRKVIARWRELESSATADPLAILPADQRALVALMVDNAAIKARQDQLAATQAVQADAIKRIEANQIGAANSVQSFTALGYSIFREIPMSKIELTKLGRIAARISKKRGITVDHVPDSRFGRVGQYHITALDEAFEEMTK